jgi:hypothetical protein
MVEDGRSPVKPSDNGLSPGHFPAGFSSAMGREPGGGQLKPDRQRNTERNTSGPALSRQGGCRPAVLLGNAPLAVQAGASGNTKRIHGAESA